MTLGGDRVGFTVRLCFTTEPPCPLSTTCAAGHMKGG